MKEEDQLNQLAWNYRHALDAANAKIAELTRVLHNTTDEREDIVIKLDKATRQIAALTAVPNASDIERLPEHIQHLLDSISNRDVALHLNACIRRYVAAARQEERAKTEMVNIEQFFPKGTQLRSPGGLSFDLKLVAGLSAEDGPDGYLDVFLPIGKVRCTFDRNSNDGGPPAIYQIKRNIEAAIREAK